MCSVLVYCLTSLLCYACICKLICCLTLQENELQKIIISPQLKCRFFYLYWTLQDRQSSRHKIKFLEIRMTCLHACCMVGLNQAGTIPRNGRQMPGCWEEKHPIHQSLTRSLQVNGVVVMFLFFRKVIIPVRRQLLWHPLWHLTADRSPCVHFFPISSLTFWDTFCEDGLFQALGFLKIVLFSQSKVNYKRSWTPLFLLPINWQFSHSVLSV